MILLILIIAYFLGALPFGYIFTRLIKRVDIRDYGSGNIGATNAMRLMGPAMGVLVLVLDIAKGSAAVLLADYLSDSSLVVLGAAFMAVVGHNFPVFLRFKGGKGVATSAGVLIPLAGWILLILLGAAGTVIALTRYVSLGSITAAVLLPLLLWAFNYELEFIIFGIVLALMVLVRHWANIGRLLRGSESRLGQKVPVKKERGES